MATTSLFTKKLSTKEWDILKTCVKDVFFFSQFINVIHPIKGKVPFLLYPYQKACLYEFLTKRFNIVLKFRQAGLTELIAMYCLWLAMYQSNKLILIVSIKDRVAKRVLRRIKYMYNNLPDYLKQPVVNGRGQDIGTASELEFANGSMIISIPTTEEAGRSDPVSLFVVDEAAIVRWMNTIWASLLPTISTGGAAIVNSTPYGVGNWYHKTWVDACAKVSMFNPIRLQWWMHPERDKAWYDEMRVQLGARKMAQEVDGDFLTSGLSVFDLNDIKALEDLLPDYAPIRTKNFYGSDLRIYNEPKKGEHYWIAADISTGRANDFTTITGFDKHGEEQFSYKGKVPTLKTAEMLMELGWDYNRAVLAPESNDVGLGCAERIQESSYPNLYYAKAFIRKKGENKKAIKLIPGWYTNKTNRPVVIDNLQQDIAQDNLIIKDPEFIREAYTFIYDGSNRPVAMGKGSKSEGDSMDEQVYTDDSIMAKAIGNHIRKGSRKGQPTLPK